eukprot:2914217-Prorocentrum_lima.AAC.1
MPIVGACLELSFELNPEPIYLYRLMADPAGSSLVFIWLPGQDPLPGSAGLGEASPGSVRGRG